MKIFAMYSACMNGGGISVNTLKPEDSQHWLQPWIGPPTPAMWFGQTRSYPAKYNTIQYNAIQCDMILYNAVKYNAIQYNTIKHSLIQYNTV